MSSFLCFICHSTVNKDTSELIREKYKEIVGMNLIQDSHLCHICCHVLHKFWMFKSVCLKRSLEYPVLFSEKGAIYLHINDIEYNNLCPNDTCHNNQRKSLNCSSFYFNDNTNENRNNDNEQRTHEYVQLRHDLAYDFSESIPNLDTAKRYNEHHYNDFNYLSGDNDKNITNENNLNVDKGCHDFREIGIQNQYSEHENTTITNDNENKSTDNVTCSDLVTEDHNIEENSNNYCCNDEDDIDNNFIVNTNDNEIIDNEQIDANNDPNNEEENANMKKKKGKKRKRDFDKIILSLEEQKAQLERYRKQKKYIEAEFKCYNCGLSFLFKDTYQAHMMRHEESNGEYRCTTCTLRFVTPALLRSHTSMHAERYRCRRCGLMMRLKQRKDHAVQCEGKTPKNEGVACHLCGNVFKDANGLSQHLRRFHHAKTSKRTYSCSVCGKSYNNQAAVRTHMIKHIQRQFPCDMCPSIFSNPYTLNHHKKKHTDTSQELYYCTICKIGYSTRKSLLAHKRKALVHQRTVFECPICNRVCPNRLALTTHMQRVHASCKQYACNVCGKQYASKESWKRHEASHMPAKEGKVYLCHSCPRSFKSNSKLNRHLREVCGKDKLEEELSAYYYQGQAL